MASTPQGAAPAGPRRLGRLRTLAEDHNQGHIFNWWGELSEGQRAALLTQVAKVDFVLLDRLIAEHIRRPQNRSSLGDIEPARPIPLPTTDKERAERQRAAHAGEEAIRAGHVAALVVAGGQGTRLDYDFPKGTYPATPVTGMSLFELHAQKILATGRRYGVAVPWYIMTSRATHAATRRYVAERAYLGLSPGNVFLFQQASLPAVGLDGRILLASKGRLAFSPNGHGGVIEALRRSGALDDMRRRGIQVVSYFQVDNPLAKVIDPVFIGHHVLQDSDLSSKAVPKRDAEEKLGVFCRSGGRLRIVEYSDLPAELKYAVGPDGSLRFGAGSIAVHAIRAGLVEELAREASPLPYHRALKRVPCIDGRGTPLKPDEPNAVKFEMFVFDALAHAANPMVMTVKRDEEFAPIKRRRGPDSPATARQAQTSLFGRWLEQAGVAVPRDAKGNMAGAIEIGPLYALDAEELRRRLPPDTVFDGQLNLQEEAPSVQATPGSPAKAVRPVRQRPD